MKLFNNLHYLPMSRIIFPLWFIFPPGFILPPYHLNPPPLEIIKWFTLYSHVPFYSPSPPGFILPPYHFAPALFPPPPGNRLMINTIYPCPISFLPPGFILPPVQFCPLESFNDLHYLPMSHIIPPLDSFCPRIILPNGKKLFNDLHYFPMSRIILPPGFILPLLTSISY